MITSIDKYPDGSKTWMDREEFTRFFHETAPAWLKERALNGDALEAVREISREEYPHMTNSRKRSFVMFLKRAGLRRVGKYYGAWDFEGLWKSISADSLAI
jgi:hypothetical protein